MCGAMQSGLWFLPCKPHTSLPSKVEYQLEVAFVVVQTCASPIWAAYAACFTRVVVAKNVFCQCSSRCSLHTALLSWSLAAQDLPGEMCVPA